MSWMSKCTGAAIAHRRVSNRRVTSKSQGRRAVFEGLERRHMLSGNSPAAPVAVAFDAIDYDESAALTHNPAAASGAHGAVGAQHWVTVAGGVIEWRARDGATEHRQPLRAAPGEGGGFFDALAPTGEVSEAQVVYDSGSERFVVAALERLSVAADDPQNVSRILIAASAANDPSGPWHYFAIDAREMVGGVDTWADSLGFAVESDAIHVTLSLRTFAAGNARVGGRLWIVNKAELYAGDLPTISQHDTYFGIATTQFAPFLPARVEGPRPNGGGTWLLAASETSGGIDQLIAIRVSNPLTAPSLSSRVLSISDTQNTYAAYPGAPQPGTTERIATGDARIADVVWRDATLYAVHTVLPTSGSEAGEETVRWYRLNTILTAVTLADSGRIDGESLGARTRTFDPSIAVDETGTMAVGFTAAGPNLFAGGYAALRTTATPDGTIGRTLSLVHGEDSFERDQATGESVWTAGNVLVLDPADPTTFWSLSQYAALRGAAPVESPLEAGRWSTRWSSIAADITTQPIRGIKWNDRDADGIRDPGEPGVAGWTVYLDANHNGLLDAGEARTITRADDPATTAIDESGQYEFLLTSAGEFDVRFLPLAGWAPTFPNQTPIASVGPTSLDAIERVVSERHAEITGLIPNRYEFLGGEIGTSIEDGGNDMYDGGNILNTDLAAEIPYTNGVVQPADAMFGAGSSYFTAKYPALFVLGVSNMNVEHFEITGDTGADGSGSVSGTQINVTVRGRTYNVFLKRTTGAGDPSIQHLVIVPSGSRQHTFSPQTNSDQQRVAQLSNARELYYLLLARRNGIGLSDAEVQLAAETFLNMLPFTGTELESINFGDRAIGKVAGFVYRDQNQNGQQDEFEPGIANWAVFADLNGNGIADSGEPSAVSVADDAATTGVIETGRFLLGNVPSGHVKLIAAPLGAWQVIEGSEGVRVSVAPADFAATVDGLVAGQNDLVANIPDRHDFTGGETGISIVDGGDGMYVIGNLLSTNLAAEIPYTDGVIVSGDAVFGPDSRYFTAKLPGLFVLGAENIAIDSLAIDGVTGSTPFGRVDGSQQTIIAGGEQFTLFVKRVYGGDAPSVNHLVLVRSTAAGLAHSFANVPHDDQHSIRGLASAGELYYLLASRQNGAYLSDADAVRLSQEFLSRIVRKSDSIDNPTFGGYPGGKISGLKWNDHDGDRVRDPGEPGLAGWTIYIDQNNNQQLDPGEISTVTREDDPLTFEIDETGTYRLDGVEEGNHRIAELAQTGWSQRFPESGTHTVNIGAADTTASLNRLNAISAQLTAIVPNRFDFTNGTSGTTISDGGSDMYDTGNRINTDRTSTALSYTNGSITTSSSQFGSSSRYFTAKYPGLFALVANDININTFSISGGLGADGQGSFDTSRFLIEVNGQTFTAFVKRVYGAANPSVNHLILVPGIGAGITHTVGATTDDDLDQLDGLGPASDIYYLLFSSNAGGYVPDANFVDMAELFLANMSSAYTATGIDFGNRENANNAVVRGTLWEDRDSDGIRDSGENGLPNWSIYLDANDNGNYDAGEPITVTAADDPTTANVNEAGAYQFLGLSSGLSIVAAFPNEANAVTFPFVDYRGRHEHRIMLAEGQIREGVDIGGRARRPDVLVRGMWQEINYFDTSPRVEDGTHFGVADVTGDTVTSTFVIYNAGDSPLQLTGNPPVQFNGAAATDFVVVTQPATTILPGRSSTFTIRFDPTVTGNRRVEVRFASNDPVHPTFAFEILGVGQASATVTANNDSYSTPEDTTMTTGFVTVVPDRASWLYFEDITRAGATAVYPSDSTPGDTWRSRGYDTTSPAFGAWKGPSPMPFAAGIIDAFSAPISPLDDAFNQNGGATKVTALFRTNFSLTSALSLSTTAIVRAICDDGCVGYINGVEVFRERMAAGPPSAAAEAVDTSLDENVYSTYNLNLVTLGVPLFADANNVFAIELHQGNNVSSDFGVDATLALAGGAVSVLGNDTRPANFTVEVVTPPTDVQTGRAIGTLVFATDNSGNFTYTPPRDFTGGVRFRYLLRDNSNASTSNGQVTIIVGSVNDAPTALDDHYSGPADRPLAVAAGAPLIEATNHLWWYVDNGSNQDTANRTWKFGPAAGFDPGAGGWLGPAIGQFGFGEGDEHTPIRPSSPAGIITYYFYSTFAVSGNPEQLVLDLKRDDGAAVYINGVEVVVTNLPTPRSFDTPALTGVADDGQVFQRFLIDTAGLNLQPTGNTIAVEVHQSDAASSDVSFDLRLFDPKRGLLSNDEDRDHPPTSMFVTNVTHAIDPATQGTLTVDSSGAFLFTPANVGVHGDFTFTYQVIDHAGAVSAPATVTLSITSADLGPVIVADDVSIPQFTTLEDTPLVIDAVSGPIGSLGLGVLANDLHPGEESAPLTVEVVRQPTSGGTVAFSAFDRGGFIYTPGENFDGIDSFSYRVFDGVRYSSEAFVNIVVQSVDDPPVAQNDEYVVPVDNVFMASATTGVLANDFDPDEDSLDDAEIVAGQEPQHGTLTLESDGSFSYTPEIGFVGVDQFQYTVLAGGVRSLPATVTLRVEQSTCAFRADINGDGVVDLADVARLVDEFGSEESSPADIDCDGRVGLLDLMKEQSELSAAPPPAPAAAVVAAARRIAAVDEVLALSANTLSVNSLSVNSRRVRTLASDTGRASTTPRHTRAASVLAIKSPRGLLLEARRARTAVAGTVPHPDRSESSAEVPRPE